MPWPTAPVLHGHAGPGPGVELCSDACGDAGPLSILADGLSEQGLCPQHICVEPPQPCGAMCVFDVAPPGVQVARVGGEAPRRRWEGWPHSQLGSCEAGHARSSWVSAFLPRHFRSACRCV